MKIIGLATRRPVTIFIFAVAAIVFGLVALGELATDLLPDITYPSLTVQTRYEGAAPIEVESLITRPVENAVGVANGVSRVTSSSRADISEVTLEFGWGTDMDMAGLDVRERLDGLRLPTEAGRPILLRFDPSLDPILRIGVHGDDDLIRLRNVAEREVKRALERLEGVAGVVVSGGLEEEIQVELDERRLANLGLDADRIRARLAAENVNLTGGRLLEGQTEFIVRTVNEFLRPDDLRSVVIDSSRGATVRLEDVATIRQGHREREVITRIDGDESVEVAIYKEGGTNTVTVSDAVQTSLDLLRQRLQEIDPRLRLTLITDQARFIRQSIRQVLETGAYGGLLAVLILFLFLRSWKTTAIIGVAIPISVVATFFLMYVFEISLNIMSLGGITLGIGLLVDNSIVVLEAIQRRRDEGLDAVEAADAGASEVGRAVVASTLTTICVFLPIVFVEGVAGQLFRDQALTVTFSLVISLLVALTVIPMLASRTFGGPVETEPGVSRVGLARAIERGLFFVFSAIARLIRLILDGLGAVVTMVAMVPARAFQIAFDAVAAIYARTLTWVLHHPVVPIAAAVVVFVLSLGLYPKLGRELIPELIQGEFFVDLQLPPGTHLDVTQRQLARLESAAADLDGVETVYALAGTSNRQGGVAGELRENTGQLTLRLTPPIDRARENARMEELRVALEGIPQLSYRFGRPSYFSFRTPIEIEIRGYNLTLLKRLSDGLVAVLRTIPGLTDVESSTEGGHPELQIRFDRQRLAHLGLNLSDVAATVRAKVQGEVATDIQREDRTVDIRVRSQESYRDSVRDLESLTIHQRGKVAIPLGAVADIDLVEGPAEIRRSQNDRVATITANLQGRDLASVSTDIERAIAAMEMPQGFRTRVSGQRQEMATSFDSMRTAILLAVFLVYLVMASQFESLLHPLVILFSVPFSVVGVLATLYVLDVTVSVVVLIGVILLAGIVVNNAIILVDYTNQLRQRGMSKIDALTEAGRVRLRPILMTTATTVLGLTPMALGVGEGSELRMPMAVTVIGGLTVSTLLTLLIIPAVYRLLARGR